MELAITNGFQTVTNSGPVPGTLDTSAISGEFAIRLEAQALTAGATAIIAIEDTASATPFSDAVRVIVFKHLTGLITAANAITQSARRADISGTRMGFSNSQLRVNVLSLSGSSPSLTLRAVLTQ